MSLGRTGEASGRIDLEWRVERGGAVLLHHAERLGLGGPGWGSAVSSGATATSSPRWPSGSDGDRRTARRRWSGPDAAAARLQIADDAWMVLAVGADRPAAPAAMRAVTALLTYN